MSFSTSTVAPAGTVIQRSDTVKESGRGGATVLDMGTTVMKGNPYDTGTIVMKGIYDMGTTVMKGVSPYEAGTTVYKDDSTYLTLLFISTFII